MKNGEFFNFLDYIFIVFMFFSAAFGFVRGFVKDFLSTCAWYGSGFIAVFVAPYLIPTMNEHIPNMILARAAAVGVSYLVILIILLLIISTFSQSIRKGVLSEIDRAVGVLFGLFKSAGFLICLHALMLIFEIPRDKYSPLKNSKLSAVLFNIAEAQMPKMKKIGIVDSIRKPFSLKSKLSIDKLFPIKKKEKEQKEKNVNIVSVSESIKQPEVTKSEIKEEKNNTTDMNTALNRLNKIKEFIINLAVKRETGYDLQEDEQPTTPSLQQLPKTLRLTNKPKYGSMSLMEARIKRRKQRKAAKMKKALQKHLDNEHL
jgi:uncharacterized membrane protein required for colicin V production